MQGLITKTARYLIALTAIFFASVTTADEPLQLHCEDCRDITEHPEDARNFALNRIFGRDSSLGFDNTRFLLTDSFGNSIIVDINAEFLLDPYDYRLLDQLFVDDILIQIVLMYQNGDLIRYKYARSLLDPNGVLPVPAVFPAVPETGSGPGAIPEAEPDEYPPDDDRWDDWDFRDENQADWEEAWGGWSCRPDFSHPNITGVICSHR